MHVIWLSEENSVAKVHPKCVTCWGVWNAITTIAFLIADACIDDGLLHFCKFCNESDLLDQSVMELFGLVDSPTLVLRVPVNWRVQRRSFQALMYQVLVYWTHLVHALSNKPYIRNLQKTISLTKKLNLIDHIHTIIHICPLITDTQTNPLDW